MFQAFEREALAGVVYIDDDGPSRVQDGSAHALVRIAVAAMLDGVHEQFAESRSHILGGLRREVRRDLAHEMSGAVRGIQLATHVERDPFRPGRDHPDVVLPGVAVERLLNQLAERTGGQGLVNVTKSPLPDRRENVIRVEVPG